jgi:hypothetical protein
MIDSARLRCSSLTSGLAYSAVAPLRTSAGVFGIARTRASGCPSQRSSSWRVAASPVTTWRMT